MTERRRYTKRQKATAVLAADLTNASAASEATGVPRSTLRRWVEDPDFADLRHNAREAIIDEAAIVARLAWQKLGDAIRGDRMEPRDLISAAGMAMEKMLLVSGEATSRSEHRDITPDDAGIDAIETILAGVGPLGEPAGVELRRNGTGANGQH